MNSNILCPIDFSEESYGVLSYLKYVSHLYEASVVLVHVIENKNPLLQFLKESDRKNLTKQIEGRLQGLANELESQYDMTVSYKVVHGAVLESILTLSEELNSSMIILGTKGSHGLKNRITGSTAFRLIREASCPVLSMKLGRSVSVVRSILLPLDTTKETKQKVESAIKFATYFKAKIHLITVVDSENFIENDLAIYQLETTQHYIQEKGITCSIKLLQENASTAKTILTYADEEKIDIIMLMTQQEANIKQWFVGSTAKEIIHHSKIPVLSIAPNIVEK